MGVLFSKQPLANLEDEIFLKGGSVVTPQNFDLVLFIKILPGNKTFPFVKIYPFVIVNFYFKWKKPSKSIIGLVCPLYKINPLSVD